MADWFKSESDAFEQPPSQTRSAKRTKIEELLQEELMRPPSHSSHFDAEDGKHQPTKKPQDKRITELLAENIQEQLVLQECMLPSTATAGSGTGTGTRLGDSRPTGYPPQSAGNNKSSKTVTAPTTIAATSTSSGTSSIEPMEGDLDKLSLHSSFFVSGVRIGWPFPVVMKPQRQMAIHLIAALKASKHVVIESPTGTGKSAAILCAVLAWQRYHAKLEGNTSTSHSLGPDNKKNLCKIIYCSRTHSQVAQMVSSLRKTPYRPRMALLGSRNHLCINTNAIDSGNVNAECRIRVGNTDALRKRMYNSRTQYYDDNDPPTKLYQDSIQSATTTSPIGEGQVITVLDDDDEPNHHDADESSRRQTSKACCSHYRQLGPMRTAVLACNTLVPCGTPKGGGEKTKHGTHDVEDLVQFGKDPYRQRAVAVYRSYPDEPFGMTLVEERGAIRIAAIRNPSPVASTCTLKVGDEILTINGVDALPSVDLAARQIGQTPPNKPLMLDVTSNPKHVTRDTDDYESEHSPCPYYLSRALAKHAQLVFCPYNYVLDPFIRESLGIGLENSVVVLDEAHNVEDTIRESGSGKFGEFELAEMVIMLQHYSSAAAKVADDDPMNPPKKDISECAHELLLFVEALMYFLIDNKAIFEQTKASKLLDEWRKFHTPDDSEFDMTFDGPNGHGVRGKAVGCATFFGKLDGTTFDGMELRSNCEAIDSHVRSKQDWETDKFGGIVDKMNELITILSYAKAHSEHYYIASIARANGSLEFASGQMAMVDRSSSKFSKKPERLPFIPPRKSTERPIPYPEVCLHDSCRARKSGSAFIAERIRHGDYCNGSQPPWEAWLVVELLTPAPFFADLRQQCRTLVLASGSLAPIPSLCAELGLGEVTPTHNVQVAVTKPEKEVIKKEVSRLQVTPKPLEADHVIDLEKQLLAVSCGFFTDGTPLTVNYSNWSKDNFIDKLGDAIATVIEAIPKGGVLVFLPSYSFLRKCVNKWKPQHDEGGWEGTWRSQDDESGIWGRLVASKGKVIVEPTGSQSKFEIAREDFAHTIATTGRCILLAVFRGKMSEGISFNDDNARGVICVGIPYPNAFNRSIKAKKTYNDEQRKIHGRQDILPGNEWYTQQAYRAIAQALGRCIRHASDYGTVVLMDSRHCDDGGPREGDLCRAHRQLPKWMRHTVKNLSRNHSGDLYAKSIPGGWVGLQHEMKRFFAAAPVHAQSVVDEQASALLKSQAQCSGSHEFDVKTGSWTDTMQTPLPSSRVKQTTRQGMRSDYQQQLLSIVTPQSPKFFDLTDSPGR